MSQAIKDQGNTLAGAIKDLANATVAQGQRTEASIDKLTAKMDTFLEALNRMERGIDRMVRSWESQQRFLQEVTQRQAQSADRLQGLVDQQLQTIN